MEDHIVAIYDGIEQAHEHVEEEQHRELGRPSFEILLTPSDREIHHYHCKQKSLVKGPSENECGQKSPQL